ncbi:extensin family protein [Rhizobiaceae bacterium CRRU44]|uniref:Extensin family protein n=1 Tax=Ferranicluibacter rubi TaxID=2715133 RepID=A0AA43ZIX1_9HYPH|nr:extensin family protein [Ferranicluibacter rubi]NHT78733.1 extensin family protein [Ferranicluibacter rubi]
MANHSQASRRISRRPLVSVGLMLALAACSTDVLEPPERMSGVRPVTAARQERVATYPVREASSPIPANGVDIDSMVTAAPVVGLAEEQSRDIHAGQSVPASLGPSSGPVLVDGIGTSSVHVLSVPTRATAAVTPAMPGDIASAASGGGDPDLPPLTPERMEMEARRKAQFLEQEQRVMIERRDKAREQQVAFLPRAGNPVDAVSEPDFSGQMPASEIACRKRLTKLGVTFTDVPRISNGPSCGIDYPIQLSGLSGDINVKPAVKLNCEVTEAFALWVKNELAPSARYRYLSGIGTIKPLGGYSCRTMNSRRGAAMSEHAHGNAIDVGKFVLKNGKEIDVRKPGFFAFREKGLLKAVRQYSCKYFNTVLGPGSDPFHKDHFHFDLRSRKSGYRHCS